MDTSKLETNTQKMDRLEAELAKARAENARLRDLLASTVELIETVYANLYSPWHVWKPKIATKLARLRAVMEQTNNEERNK